MKKSVAAILVFCICALPALSERHISNEDFEELNPAITALAAMRLGAGLQYPDEDITDEYARGFLYFMANLPGIVLEGGETVYSEDDDEDPRAVLSLPYNTVDTLMHQAFGGLYNADDLEMDGDILSSDGERILVLCNDDFPLTVEYAGEENPVLDEDTGYLYRYTLEDGELPEEGTFTVSFSEDDEEESLYVTGVEMAEVDNTIVCNWCAEDGSWFSLMDDGLVFCFDENSNYVADGTWNLDGETLWMQFGDVRTPGSYDGSEIRISVNLQEERVYTREIF